MSTLSLNDTNNHNKSFGDKIKTFCKDSDWRRFIYVLLIMFAMLPAMADAMDVFFQVPGKSNNENYVLDEFCDDSESCTYGFIGSGIIVIAMVFSWLARTYHDLFYHPRVCRRVAMLLLVIGSVFFVVSIVFTWINLNEHTTCYLYLKESGKDNDSKAVTYCKLQYFGEGLGQAVVVLAALMEFVFMECWPHGSTKIYLRNRLGWLSLALWIWSVCAAINLIANGKVYRDNELANTSYYLCCIGYILVCIGNVLSVPLLLSKHDMNYKNEIGLVSVCLLLAGVMFAQSRRDRDLVVYTLMCMICTSDSYVLKDI